MIDEGEDGKRERKGQEEIGGGTVETEKEEEDGAGESGKEAKGAVEEPSS